MKDSFSDAHPFTKIIFSLFIILVSFLFVFLIGLIAAIPIFDINFSDLTTVLSDYNNPDNLNFLKYLQTLQAIGLFIVPAFLIAYLFHKNPARYLGFQKNFSLNSLALTIFIFFVSIPLISYLGLWNGNMHLPEGLSGIEQWMKEKEDSAKLVTDAFLKMDNIGTLIFNLFMIGILPAIGEELIFRGVFQKIIGVWAKNMHVGILISAFLFSTMHFQFYGFIPRFILGSLLGYLFYWSGSIWIPILGHFVNNSIAIVSYFFYKDQTLEVVESIAQETIIFVSISTIILSVSLLAFYKECTRIAKS